jgi:hypothetical protein
LQIVATQILHLEVLFQSGGLFVAKFPQILRSQISFFCIVVESMLMEELWLIIVIAVGIISIATAIAFLTRKKKQAIQDNALLPLGITFVVLGIVFGDDRLVGYSFIGVGVLLSIISAVRGLRKK